MALAFVEVEASGSGVAACIFPLRADAESGSDLHLGGCTHARQRPHLTNPEQAKGRGKVSDCSAFQPLAPLHP